MNSLMRVASNILADDVLRGKEVRVIGREYVPFGGWFTRVELPGVGTYRIRESLLLLF